MKRVFGKLFILGCLILLPSCLGWFLEKPTFTLKEISVARISSTGIDFVVGIEVQNPNHFDLKIRSLEYAIFLNDNQVGTGRLEKAVRIAKSSSARVEVPLQADFRKKGNLLESILLGQPLRYKIEGVVILDAVLGSATVPFSQSGEFPVPRK